MSSATHECPAPGCIMRVQHDRLACQLHWYSIPADKRARLWREYQAHFGETSYFEARADCLRALGVPEHAIPDENAGIA